MEFAYIIVWKSSSLTITTWEPPYWFSTYSIGQKHNKTNSENLNYFLLLPHILMKLRHTEEVIIFLDYSC